MTALFLLGQVADGNGIGSERWTGGGTTGLMLVTLVLFIGLGLGAWYLSGVQNYGAGQTWSIFSSSKRAHSEGVSF